MMNLLIIVTNWKLEERKVPLHFTLLSVVKIGFLDASIRIPFPL